MPRTDRPIILLTTDLVEAEEDEYRLRANYAEAITEAGGAPLMLPCEAAGLDAVVAAAHGVVITGTAPGASVSERRRSFEAALVERALARDMPLLGICHGMQVIGEALGGTIGRDLPNLLVESGPHIPHPVPDRLAHPIRLANGSRLAHWSGGKAAQVNSLHRHALVGAGAFQVAAWAPDGVLEAFEVRERRFCLGVQWHPEYRLTTLDRRVLVEFVRCAAGG